MSDNLPKTLDRMLEEGPVPINVGVLDFANALEIQGIAVVSVEWSPPAGGDDEMAKLLESLL